MRSVLDKIGESFAGDVTTERDWLSEHVEVLPEDRVRPDPEMWAVPMATNNVNLRSPDCGQGAAAQPCRAGEPLSTGGTGTPS